MFKALKLCDKPVCVHKERYPWYTVDWKKVCSKMLSIRDFWFIFEWKRPSFRWEQEKPRQNFTFLRVKRGEDRRKPWEPNSRKKQAWLYRDMTAARFHTEVWVELACSRWRSFVKTHGCQLDFGCWYGPMDKSECRKAIKARIEHSTWTVLPLPHSKFCHESGSGGRLEREITKSRACFWLMDPISLHKVKLQSAPSQPKHWQAPKNYSSGLTFG